VPQQDIRMQGGDEVRQPQAHLPLQAGQLPGHHLPQQGPAVRGNLRDPPWIFNRVYLCYVCTESEALYGLNP
jgi:hypothetical protein